MPQLLKRKMEPAESSEQVDETQTALEGDSRIEFLGGLSFGGHELKAQLAGLRTVGKRHSFNPRKHGKPIGIVPVLPTTTCCIAASYAAKARGVEVGTGIAEARALWPRNNRHGCNGRVPRRRCGRLGPKVYPDPNLDGPFDPSAVPVGGPYPPHRGFPLPPTMPEIPVQLSRPY